MWPTMEHSKLENMLLLFFFDCYTSKLPQHSGQRETWLKFRYCTKVSMVARVSKDVERQKYPWEEGHEIDIWLENIYSLFLWCRNYFHGCRFNADHLLHPEPVQYDVPPCFEFKHALFVPWVLFVMFFGCLMFNGSIFSLLCRGRECLCSSIYLCLRVRTSMRRSQKRRQTNYPKRGRERDRSCRPFPVRAFICPCEVCLCCTFVFLCVCVCVKVCYFLFWRFQHTAGGIRAVGWRGPQKTHPNCCENVPASWRGDETMLNFEFWCLRVDKLFFALFSLEQPCSL